MEKYCPKINKGNKMTSRERKRERKRENKIKIYSFERKDNSHTLGKILREARLVSWI